MAAALGRETALAKAENIVAYVATGPLFERLVASLPNGPALERVPSDYWKVIATSDGGMSAFVFDQRTSRDADYCTMRVSLTTVTLRTRLVLFPAPDTPLWKPLDGAIGCNAPSARGARWRSDRCRGSALTPENECWGAASMVLAQHGDPVFRFIATPIIALVLDGDEAGVTRWREIERCVARLICGPVQ